MPPDDPRHRCPDISRARQVLRWSPKVTRTDGLKKMIDSYREVAKVM
jgi:nucleoside-diphosphate-sugar epimerase